MCTRKKLQVRTRYESSLRCASIYIWKGIVRFLAVYYSLSRRSNGSGLNFSERNSKLKNRFDQFLFICFLFVLLFSQHRRLYAFYSYLSSILKRSIFVYIIGKIVGNRNLILACRKYRSKYVAPQLLSTKSEADW